MQGTMSDKFRVTFSEATADEVTLIFRIAEELRTDTSASIIVNIYKAELSSKEENPSVSSTEYKKFGNVVLPAPFEDAYAFENLDPESNYKFNCYLTTRSDTHFAIVVAGTKIDLNRKKKTVNQRKLGTTAAVKEDDSQLTNSEKLLFHFANVQNHGLRIFKDRKDIHKNILDARIANKWNNFANSNYKVCKPIATHDLRKKRMWLVAQGLELYEDVYGIRDAEAGSKLLQNDWFMGPFYSYDPNFDKLKRNHTTSRL